MGIELSLALGAIIRGHRRQKGLSQEELAEKAGVHRTYMGAIERGEKNITVEMAQRVASALDLTLAELFAEIGDKNV